MSETRANSRLSGIRHSLLIVTIIGSLCATSGLRGQELASSEKEPQATSDEEAQLDASLERRRNEASVLRNAGRDGRQKCVELHEQIVSEASKFYSRDRYPDGHPQIIDSLTDLAAAYGTTNRHRKSIELQQRALRSAQKLYPKAKWPEGAVRTAVCQTRLAQYHIPVGDFPTFQKLLNEAAETLSTAKPEPSFDLAYAQMEIGFLYVYIRDIHNARKHCLIAANTAAGLDTVPNEYLDNLAVLYAKCSWVFYQSLDFEEAKVYARRALRLTEQLPDGKVLETKAQSLRCLGNICRNLGEYREAAGYFERAHALFVKAEIGERGKLASEIAGCYIDVGDLEGATHWLDRAADYKGPRAPSEALIKSLRGGIELRKGHYDLAFTAYQEALKATPPGTQNTRNIAAIHQGLGVIEFERGNDDEAAEWFEKAWRQRKEEFFSVIPSSSETYVLKFLRDYWSVSELYLGATRSLDSPKQRLQQYQIISHQRGLAGRVLARRHRIRKSMDVSRSKLYENYLAVVTELGEVGRDHRGRDADRKSERLRLRRDLLEQQLADNVPDLMESIRELQTPVEQIQAALGPGELLLDFVRYHDRNQSAYAVFIVGKDSVRRVEIDDADGVENLVQNWRKNIAAGKFDRATASSLYERLWQPIERLIPGETESISLCADGVLYLLPWNALQVDDDTVLLEKYTISLPPSPQDLVRDKADFGRKSSHLLVAGDIDYGNAPQLTSAARSEPSDSHRWAPLKYSGVELGDIAKLSKEAQVECLRLEGKDASRANVLAKIENSTWIHLATHGFGEAPTSNDARNALTYESLRDCGLVFASADQQSGTGKAADAHRRRNSVSILRGARICNLDLRKAKLVFLSACDSGVGRVYNGEGIFGLQRAFHQAGAENVICSLWQVDDAATAALVQIFYRNYWSNGQSAARALRDAQLEIYRNPFAIEKYAASRGIKLVAAPDEQVKNATNPPRLWAGFIFSGRDQTHVPGTDESP